MSLKINKKRIDPFMKSCKVLWNYEENVIKNGHQLKIMNNGETVTVNIFNNTGQVQCQGSPDMPFLKCVKTKTKLIAKTIELPFCESDNQLIHRAQMLLSYIKTFDLEQVIQRMSTVIICDTSCEILLKARIAMIIIKKEISTKKLNLSDRKDMYKFILKQGYI